MLRTPLACFFALSAALASAQSIVKCVDSEGNVTYQDAPCTKGAAGRSVELPKAEPREDTSAWEEAAKAVRALERLDERKREAWTLETTRAAQLATDEVAQTHHGREVR